MIEVGDIVQATPESDWSCALVVVTEVKSWGVQGFTQVPRGGRAYIRLAFEKFEKTGGKAVFMPADESEDA